MVHAWYAGSRAATWSDAEDAENRPQVKLAAWSGSGGVLTFCVDGSRAGQLVGELILFEQQRMVYPSERN
jgi:hypothetical protein